MSKPKWKKFKDYTNKDKTLFGGEVGAIDTPASDTDVRGKASPLPWKVKILESQRDREALLLFGDRSLQMSTPDAIFVALAVNNHAKLIEALEAEHAEADKTFTVGYIHEDKPDCRVCKLIEQSRSGDGGLK